MIGLSSAKMTQAAMNGSTSHSSTLQASAIAATDLDLLRSTEYKDLSSSAKAAVPDSPYFHETIVSNESSYSDTIKQKTATVKVYKGSETIPRAEVKLTRYSAESKPSGLPIGTIIAWASNTIPTEGGAWLECNGQSCSSYPALVNVLGKSTVPDYRGRFLEGADTAGTVLEAGLPNVLGRVNTGTRKTDQYPEISEGALYISGYGANDHAYDVGVNTKKYQIVSLDASRSNPIYGASTTVQPPSVTVRYFIKAA